MTRAADWQLPVGVDRKLWEYLTEPEVADRYDAVLAGHFLLGADLKYLLERLGEPARLVDLGCGTGRVAGAFAGRRGEYVGIDLSDEMLRVAAAKFAEAAGVHFVKANLVDLGGFRDESFDAAVCLFSTFGMIRGPHERRSFLVHSARMLRPGGRLILHAHNYWFNARDAAGRWWLAADAWRRLVGSPRAGDREMPPHQRISGLTLHHFTRAELESELRRAGLQVEDVTAVGIGGASRPARRGDGFTAYGWLATGVKPG